LLIKKHFTVDIQQNFNLFKIIKLLENVSQKIFNLSQEKECLSKEEIRDFFNIISEIENIKYQTCIANKNDNILKTELNILIKNIQDTFNFEINPIKLEKEDLVKDFFKRLIYIFIKKEIITDFVIEKKLFKKEESFIVLRKSVILKTFKIDNLNFKIIDLEEEDLIKDNILKSFDSYIQTDFCGLLNNEIIIAINKKHLLQLMSLQRCREKGL